MSPAPATSYILPSVSQGHTVIFRSPSSHFAPSGSSWPVSVSKASLSGQISTLLPMPASALRSSVSTFSSVTAAVRPVCPSGAYSSPVPRQISSPFRWYMPFTFSTSRTFLRRARVCSAGNPRPEKFSAAESSASLQLYVSLMPPKARSSWRLPVSWFRFVPSIISQYLHCTPPAGGYFCRIQAANSWQ